MKVVIRYSILFWLLAYLIFCILLSSIADLQVVMIRVVFFLLPQIIVFYLNLLIFLPRFFEEKRKKTYFLWTASILLVLAVIFGFGEIYLDEKLPLGFHPFQKKLIGFAILGRLMTLIPPLLIGALIRKTYLLQLKTKESLELQNKMLEAETKALKAQINPHFLFNTLNNIYSLSQFDNKKTGEAILQLSDIFRYVTYEGNDHFVPLNSEIELLESFIKLQYLQDEDQNNVSVEITLENSSLQISPLLILPFIENCFKHANHQDKVNGWIKIKIENKGNELFIHAENTISKAPIKKDKSSGVGMENVKRRLELLYPKRHELEIKVDKSVYVVRLTINLIA
jgi:two-component system LytT family sensor kinase